MLFSGGQDSDRPASPGRLPRFARVETVGFDYGQRHAVELDCREPLARRARRRSAGWGGRLGADHLVDLRRSLAAIGETALDRPASTIAMTEAGLPNTFVPGRNLLFLTYAAAIAYRRGLRASSAACARRTIPATRTAATTR